MGLRLTIIGICTAGLAQASFAQTLTASWVEIANNLTSDSVPDYSVGALVDDPTLALTPARTFDLKVTTTSPIRWTSCDLQINLSGSQTIYVSPNGSMRDAKSATWATKPSNEFSTFLSIFNYGSVMNVFPNGMLLGKAQYPVESGTGTATLTSTNIDAAWGTLSPFVGSGTIARVTILDGFSGGINFAGRVGTANNVIGPTDTSYSGYAFRTASLSAPANPDANADGSIDTQDFNVLAGHFGNLGSLPVSSGNFNADLIVDSRDMNILLAQYGTHVALAPLGAVVPEPASVVLAAAGLMLSRRRR